MAEDHRHPTGPELRCGLYIHIPFCASKCGYCDFYSVEMGDGDAAPLVQRLCRELTGRVASSPHPVGTIFIGGGTPTALPISQLKAVSSALSEVVAVGRLDEFTVEANPATVDDDKAEVLARAGVSRVSMGAQSFLAGELAVLDRRHTPVDIAPSLQVLRRHGIARLNLDLIFGIPGQTLATWSQSLQRAVEMDVEHISAYGLTYEPGTRLTTMRQQGLLRPCDKELEAEMYLRASDVLGDAGYEQYEISNYARPGCQCLHNLIYWKNGPFIGVGPSATGCVTRRRYKNVSDLADYVRLMDKHGHAEAEVETLDTPSLVTELIMMQLRLTEGLSLGSFRTHTGLDALELFGSTLGHLTAQGLIAVSPTHVALTREGRLLADAVIAELAGTFTADAPPTSGRTRRAGSVNALRKDRRD